METLPGRGGTARYYLEQNVRSCLRAVSPFYGRRQGESGGAKILVNRQDRGRRSRPYHNWNCCSSGYTLHFYAFTFYAPFHPAA
jgi:hypothetical protein